MSNNNTASTSDDEDNSIKEQTTCTCTASRNAELELLRKVRLALAATLHMLECARDDLVALGDRMDRLRIASEQCRVALQEKKKKETASDRIQDDTAT
jgi:hypothetical protein